MNGANLVVIQSDILDTYYADNAKKLHNVVDRILCKFGGLSSKDTDDFYSLANEVFVDVMKRYDYEQSFDGFLYSCLSNKIMSEITKRNREKRKADRMAVSLDAVSESGEECCLLDFIASDFDTFEEVVRNQDKEKYQDKVQMYISKLSNRQVNILNLLIDGYQSYEIRNILEISSKEYADNMQIMRSYENVKVYFKEGITMKIRKQTNSLDQYLKLMNAETIRTDQDCQRLSGQWSNNMVGELIATVLTDNYMPPIILGEETVRGITRQWIIDGLQRSSSLSLFRYANTKIAKNLDEYIVTYQRKILDGNGNPKRDGQGEIIWESVEYDIRNKTYNQLPEELKDRFNGYQMECAIHQDCDTMEISKLVRKYNNHTSMNQAQRAFTYVDTFAKEIREITENRFFLDIYTCNRNDRKNGTLERIVGDMVILCNYTDQYRKDSKAAFKWLNENGTIADFNNLNDLLTRLAASAETTKEIRALFNNKNTSVFVAAFKAFTELGMEDTAFGKFLGWFVSGGSETEINGKSWNMLDTSRSTRDTGTVHGKIDYLVALIEKYFDRFQKAA